MFTPLTPAMLVAGQISPADVAEAAAQGVTLIVNNRPDREQPGQPAAAEIAEACAAAGVAYAHVPVDHSGFRPDQATAMAQAMQGHDKVLAFCRSGTRSTFLWALARAHQGDDPDALVAAAAGGGYDIRPVYPALKQLSGR